MQKEDIQLQQVIVHIMDSSTGIPVLSDQLLDWGSDFGDLFSGAHIFRLLESDDARDCVFAEDSVTGELIRSLNQENFVEITGKNRGTSLRHHEPEYRYSAGRSGDRPVPAGTEGLSGPAENELQKLLHPHDGFRSLGEIPIPSFSRKRFCRGENQKLSEAALIRLEDCAIRLWRKSMMSTA